MIALDQVKSVGIPLVNGGITWVSAEDAPRAMAYRWCSECRKGRTVSYARSAQWVNGKRILLHRFLMDPPEELEVDHRDGDGLNNRRSNLRIATRSQNGANRHGSNKLGVKGVRVRSGGRFEARIVVSGRYIHLGDFDTSEQAGKAYQQAASTYFGEFAKWANQAK